MILIQTNCPTEAAADAIADVLLDRRLVACSNRHAPIRSRYRWQGRIEEETEIPLVVKTRPDLAETVEAVIRQHHPYETPAIIRIEATANADYLEWIAAETS